MSGRSRRHHFVPKALQRHFSENRKNIWFTSCDDLGKYSKPEWRNISSTFQRHDFYTVIDDSGVPSDQVEKEFYEKVDDYLGDLLSEIHHSLDLSQNPVFEGEVLESLQNLFMVLATRTAHSLTGAGHDDFKQGIEFVNKIIERISEVDPDSLELKRYQDTLEDSRKLISFGRNIRVRAMTTRLPRAEKELRNYQARIAVSHGSHSFILHGRAVYRIGNGSSNGILSPTCELWLPISTKRAIILLRDPSGNIPLICTVGREQMRELNLHAVSLGSDLGSRSEKLLVSLIGKHKRDASWQNKQA